MLLGRTQEVRYLENNYKKSGNQLIVMYGRENIGKTSLIMEFCREKLFSYYLARPCSELEQLKLWAGEVGQDKVRPEYSSIFPEILSEGSSKFILVIDEFHNIVKNSELFMREIVNFIHNRYNYMPVMVILCSSSVGFVENSLVTKIGEAAYEITGFLEVRELGFLELSGCFRKYSMRQCVELYAVLGGVPGLWQYVSDDVDVRGNICRAILKKGAVLRTEAERYVSQELREPAVYHTILNCIAAGKRKLNDLYLETGFSRAKISVYLKNLTELEIVEKISSMDTAGRDNAMKGIYRIRSPYVNFWFRFVFANYSKLELMTEEEFYDMYIAPEFDAYAAGVFPVVCREYLNRLNQAGRLPIKCEKSGRWIGKNGTIDIMAMDREGRTLLGACGFSEDEMTYENYQKLLSVMKQARVKADYIYLFSAGEFDDELQTLAQRESNIELIRLSQL